MFRALKEPFKNSLVLLFSLQVLRLVSSLNQLNQTPSQNAETWSCGPLEVTSSLATHLYREDVHPSVTDLSRTYVREEASRS